MQFLVSCPPLSPNIQLKFDLVMARDHLLFSPFNMTLKNLFFESYFDFCCLFLRNYFSSRIHDRIFNFFLNFCVGMNQMFHALKVPLTIWIKLLRYRFLFLSFWTSFSFLEQKKNKKRMKKLKTPTNKCIK